ncbi:Protein of unknown function [Pyronema omphalodes CBS 100304]|uniref:Uncharacterized protein n=1 Tax=Pyronema omphalodes (strain CBS 100304) TaxID=1076935 RepID=U4LM03_PYROM|nr:Protein of unknown function [Pyronema omphalodes CBS 100304]
MHSQLVPDNHLAMAMMIYSIQLFTPVLSHISKLEQHNTRRLVSGILSSFRTWCFTCTSTINCGCSARTVTKSYEVKLRL